MTGGQADLPDLTVWGAAGPLRLLRGGARNRVFHASEAGLVLKSTRRSDAALDWLAQLAPLMQRAGLTVPHMVRTRAGRWAAQGWMAERFAAGRAARSGELATLADAMLRFHGLTAHVGQRPGFLSARDLLTASQGGDVDLSAMPERLVLAMRTAWSVLEPRTCVIHGDLNPGNVVMGADGPVLLDWDETRVDHPAFDAVALGRTNKPRLLRAAEAWEIACCWQTEPARARGLAAGFMSAVCPPIP